MSGRTSAYLAPPFPYYGGKRKVASLIWSRLGEPNNYIEPFYGSMAVLLARPPGPGPRHEIAGDLDALLSNFWRAIKADPQAVAWHADYPVSHADLRSRHLWLTRLKFELGDKWRYDPDFYDAKAAGWWLWGICQWIGTDWCSGKGSFREPDEALGVYDSRPNHNVSGVAAVYDKRPHKLRMGIHALDVDAISDEILTWLLTLHDRLRSVKLFCRDWSELVTDGVLGTFPVVGVFLDPPYDTDLRDNDLYNHDGVGVSAAVRAWCIANGERPQLRLALAGIDGEHAMPDTWEKVVYKTQGGYAHVSRKEVTRAKENLRRECLWFSPHCLKPSKQMSLADLLAS